MGWDMPVCSLIRGRDVTRGGHGWFKTAFWWGCRWFPTSASVGYGKKRTILGRCCAGTLAAMHISVVVLYRLVECLLVGVRQEVEVCNSACLRENGVHAMRMEVSAGVTVPCGDLVVPDRL